MIEKHISSQFDADLRDVCARVLEMGGLAEAQTAQALYALTHYNMETAELVVQQEERVNRMEVEIDTELQRVIALRQPAAGDLRLLFAVSKASGNLERVGDEAARIARTVQRLVNTGVSSRLRLPVGDLAYEGELAIAQMRKALDAFARMDAECALDVLKHDAEIDEEFDGLMRKLITYMMEDPRTISASIDLVFVAKAIERIGDHAKNLAEAVIYVVKGTDVRHVTVEAVENVVR
jgi:phosphate transport system protein